MTLLIGFRICPQCNGLGKRRTQSTITGGPSHTFPCWGWNCEGGLVREVLTEATLKALTVSNMVIA